MSYLLTYQRTANLYLYLAPLLPPLSRTTVAQNHLLSTVRTKHLPARNHQPPPSTPQDGSRLFMGAPGSHVWQGQVFAHNLKTDLENATSSVNPHSEDDSYLGYSIALGRFSAHSSSSAFSSETDVAIGMPRGHDLAGKIVITDREMRILRNITGEQMGAYFGYAMASADVNNDGLDDLIIGAPLYYNQTISHKEPHFERGRVYVALQNNRHEFKIANRIDGRKNRARFGTAIANCGDLNRDGFHEIAVGAPYDGPEGRGVVYIFMGRKSGLNEE